MKPTSDGTSRQRVLMSAYGCAPDRGSEAGIAWRRAVESARFHDTWLIREESEFAGSVRNYLAEHGEIPGLHSHVLPQGRCQSLLWHIPGLGYVAYNLSQRRALRLARRLDNELHFDLGHHANFGTYREPGHLWKLRIPFIWGRFGGTQYFPLPFLPRAGARGALREALRNACNWAQLRLSRRIRRAAYRARLVLAAKSTTRRDFQRVLGVRPELLSDVGVAESRDKERAERAPGPFRILWVGHLGPNEALNLLIEALPLLPADAAYQLRVVGDGPQQHRWQQVARHKRLQQHVGWIGRVRR
jgi:glycosyltransferase involved in cell wall biosynthesis